MNWLLETRHLLLIAFAGSALWVHLRGRMRFNLLRAMTDFTVLLAPFNVLMYLFSRTPARAYIDPSDFPELAPLQQHWQTIRDEATRLDDEGQIRAAATYNDIGFNSFFRTGWKRFYLKWYGEDLASARALCPQTVALLAGIPGVKAAMFASLPPGARLVRHRDPYAGSLRYHLGLSTPNSPGCYIEVDGQRYHWRDGEAVMFDETYIHWAENKSDVTRLILFCDVERPLKSRIMSKINHWFEATAIRASQTENAPGDQIGVLNRIFSVAYYLRLPGKALKKKSKLAYYVVKWLIVFGLLYLLLR